MNLIIKGNTATLGSKSYPVAVGKGGFSANKVEGDGATPIGSYPLRTLYYREDRVTPPQSLPVKAIALTQQDGWCDAPDSPDYNRFVHLPYSASHERLWREDHVYDLILVMGHNDDPAIPGKGSAVFTHIARENYTPTEGCLAFKQDDLLEILQILTPDSKIVIQGE